MTPTSAVMQPSVPSPCGGTGHGQYWVWDFDVFPNPEGNLAEGQAVSEKCGAIGKFWGSRGAASNFWGYWGGRVRPRSMAWAQFIPRGTRDR